MNRWRKRRTSLAETEVLTIIYDGYIFTKKHIRKQKCLLILINQYDFSLTIKHRRQDTFQRKY